MMMRMMGDHSLREHSSQTLLLRFLISTQSSGRHLMKLLRHLMQWTVHSPVSVLEQTGHLFRCRSSQQMQSPWKTCPQVSRTEPPLASQMLQRLVSLILTFECYQESFRSSSSEASGALLSRDSMLVGLSVYLARQSWILKMLQMRMAMKSSPMTMQRMMRRAESTQSAVSQLASYQPWQVRQAEGESVVGSITVDQSHSSQFSSVQSSACAAATSNTNSNASLTLIHQRYILSSKISKDTRGAGWRKERRKGRVAVPAC